MFSVTTVDLNLPYHTEALLQLLNEYACGEMGGGVPISPAVMEQLVTKLQQRHDYLGILALDGRSGVGLINAFEGFSTFLALPLLNIHDVVVSRSHRRQGVSRMMFVELEKIARERNYCKITLEVLEGNSSAQAAYRSFGFDGYELEPSIGKALFWEKVLTSSLPEESSDAGSVADHQQ